jgi:hypothetical protein
VSPLSLAAKNGYNGICKELLDRACIKNQENIDRLTGENHRKVVKVFKEKNTTIVKKTNTFSGGERGKQKKAEMFNSHWSRR